MQSYIVCVIVCVSLSLCVSPSLCSWTFSFLFCLAMYAIVHSLCTLSFVALSLFLSLFWSHLSSTLSLSFFVGIVLCLFDSPLYLYIPTLLIAFATLAPHQTRLGKTPNATQTSADRASTAAAQSHGLVAAPPDCTTEAATPWCAWCRGW